MRNFKTFVLIAVMTLGFNSLQAQDNVAHVNFQEIVELMPEFKAMVADVEKMGKTFEDDIKKAAEDLQAKMTKYNSEGATQTPETNAKRQDEVVKEEQALYAAQQQAQQALQNRRNELLKPIVEKLTKTIEDVAAEQNIEYVMDRTSLIVAKGTDLKPLVLTKLNITE
ncbi:OmpH family outer membrane protein [Urechidicola vernalis]|uniref:OmpH family outer membrane protein n=1 Tax=Urechidicola vernalis TaxID=3075600 RepID=A0ABU2Y5Y7_9FLAO|nr:OmpH family outer membrane protein [Urechidicola sp. P050]MDT0553097.1 OmpH family outer membrane protein [Urechidicola sp. P050]